MPVTKQLEFGGVLGTTLLVTGLPLAILLINIACNKTACTLLSLSQWPSTADFFDGYCVIIYLLWFLLQLLLASLPIGAVNSGLPLRNGSRLEYRCNGFIALIFSLIIFVILCLCGVDVSYVHRKFLAMATVAIGFSLLLSVLLYVKSLSCSTDELAAGGNSGYFIYDFFMGRELNPRIGRMDLKFVCELRPGLIGWVMLDLCFLMTSFQQQQSDSLPLPLLTVVIFHVWYVTDALWHEAAILTTMDIVHDGFGFMLVLGDLAWVPFLYSLQARFVFEHSPDWSVGGLLGIVTLHVIGFLIFRISNSQKNRFRQNPNDPSIKGLRTMPTASGKQLLISGLWGSCRHPNYMGDLLMAFSWSLPSGFSNILPYFYPIYFLGLLIHRGARDERHCRIKYGPDWDKYCRLVPYRIFPYIY